MPPAKPMTVGEPLTVWNILLGADHSISFSFHFLGEYTHLAMAVALVECAFQPRVFLSRVSFKLLPRFHALPKRPGQTVIIRQIILIASHNSPRSIGRSFASKLSSDIHELVARGNQPHSGSCATP